MTNLAKQNELLDFVRGYLRTSPKGLEMLFLVEWQEQAQAERKRREYKFLEGLPDELLNAIASGSVQVPKALGDAFRNQKKTEAPSVTDFVAPEAKDELLPAIAARFLGIPTLTPQNSDALDFHEVHVAGLLRALSEAFDAGKRAK